MKKLRKLLFVLSVSLLLTSCGTTERFLNSRGYVKTEQIAPAQCPASAFIDRKEFVLDPPASVEEADFKKFVVAMATRYPNLLLSYDQLRECWDFYHPQTQKASN